MKLKDYAHIRTGDKGNDCNICVIPYKTTDYTWLKTILTVEKISSFYSEVCKGDVLRYDVDSIHAFNFVLKNSLGGGVTCSLCQDRHGKALGMALAELDIS